MKLDRPTLGGAIILRKESEILAKKMQVFKINVIVNKGKYKKKIFESYFKQVFMGSKYKFKICYDFKKKDIYWPIYDQKNSKFFLYTSFDRINKLVNSFKIKPILEWNKKTISQTKAIRKNLPKNTIAVHLKNIFPHKEQESNADGKVWNDFFNHSLKNKKVGFLLMGDDNIPKNINFNKNIFFAKKLKIPLSIQLCLVSMCSGFLGMASGPSVAANFSNVPYYIFKHPKHDIKEIEKEIGNKNKLHFANKNQIILRKIPTLDFLKKINFNSYGRI